MSVNRYNCTDGGYRHCQGCFTMERDDEYGDYVTFEDFDALRATVARLREALELIADATNAPCTCGAGCEEIAAAAIAAVEGEK